MSESIEFTFDLPVSPERAYHAWLDPGQHSRFTGQPAEIVAAPGGAFRSLGGQVSGELRTLTPVDHILQSWRIQGLTAQAGLVDLRLTPTCSGCEVHLHHSGIPAGQSRRVLAWWETVYFRPLEEYFEAWVAESGADSGNG